MVCELHNSKIHTKDGGDIKFPEELKKNKSSFSLAPRNLCKLGTK